MKKSTNKNLLLGIFVTVALLIFIFAIYFIGSEKNMFGNTTRISSVFKNVNGLQIGNNVRFSGVNVGTVKSISIINDTSICVDMIIDEDAIKMVKPNAQATISSDGLVGSMIINIIPSDDYFPGTLKSGDTIESISKIATADMLNTLNTTNENAALLTADLLKITNAINNGEGTIGALLKNDSVTEDFKNSISNFEKTSKAALFTIQKINKTISEIDMHKSVAGKLLNDTLSAEKVTVFLDNLEASSAHIKEISKNLKDFSETINTSDGTMSHIISDTTMVNNLKETLKNVESASEKFDENMEALKHNFFFRGYFRKLERKKERALQMLED